MNYNPLFSSNPKTFEIEKTCIDIIKNDRENFHIYDIERAKNISQIKDIGTANMKINLERFSKIIDGTLLFEHKKVIMIGTFASILTHTTCDYSKFNAQQLYLLVDTCRLYKDEDLAPISEIIAKQELLDSVLSSTTDSNSRFKMLRTIIDEAYPIKTRESDIDKNSQNKIKSLEKK